MARRKRTRRKTFQDQLLREFDNMALKDRGHVFNKKWELYTC